MTAKAGLKVLIVTPYPVWPLTHGGRVRTFRLAAGLRRAGVTVDLLCPWVPAQPWRSVACDGVTVHPQVLATSALRLVVRERWVPSLVTLSLEPAWTSWSRRIRRFADYDVVQFEFCPRAAWMSMVSGRQRVVYSAHNVEADYTRAQIGRRVGLRAFARRVESLERRAVANSDLILACTDDDAQRLRELYAPRVEIETVPNGFDEALLDFDRDRLRASARARFGLTERDLAILFVGGRAPHNVDAVRFLCADVIPRLPPRAHLLVAGDCGEAVGAGLPGRIHRLGFIPDLQSLWAAADVAVNPVAFGSGSNLKLIEYLAVGLPVVTTPIGLRGYEEFGSAMTVVPRERFVTTLARPLVVDRDVRTSLAPLSWTMIGRRLSGTYGRLVRDPASPASAAHEPAVDDSRG
jgi:glycosyltransferase involved in cell wall biosynthesis